MYPEMDDWLRVRNKVDPDGMFVGDWHRRLLIPQDGGLSNLPLEERITSTNAAKDGGVDLTGHIPRKYPSPQTSEESFEMMHGVEAEKSFMMHDST